MGRHWRGGTHNKKGQGSTRAKDSSQNYTANDEDWQWAESKEETADRDHVTTVALKEREEPLSASATGSASAAAAVGVSPASTAGPARYPPPPPDGYTCCGPHRKFYKKGKDQKYMMFSAAHDGCLYCVRQWIEEFKEDVHAKSANVGYNLLDYAVDARVTGNVATEPLEEWLYDYHGLALSQAVAGRRGGSKNDNPGQGSTRAPGPRWEGELPPGREAAGLDRETWFGPAKPRKEEEKEPDRAIEYPPPPKEGYTCVGPHEKWWKPDKDVKYKMFSAAADGCLYCVRQWIVNEGGDKDAVSDNMQYNLLDFAVEARVTGNIATVPLEKWLRESTGIDLTTAPTPPGEGPPGPRRR